MEVKHINTKCMYGEEGQLISVIEDGDYSHFVDHTRMVRGTVLGTALVDVIEAYIMGDYTNCTMSQKEYEAVSYLYAPRYYPLFEDWGRQYRSVLTIIEAKSLARLCA